MQAAAEPEAVLGPFRLGQVLAYGSSSTVYVATMEPSHTQEVALKVLDGSLTERPGFLDRLQSTLVRVMRMRHQGVLPILRFGTFDGQTCVATTLVSGGTLRSYLAEGPLEPQKALALLRRVAGAVHMANESGIVHRDLCPGNVFFNESGEPLLGGFGTAPIHLGISVGTPGYLPPEQARGEPSGREADVFSLGAIAFEALTGTPPFGPGSTTELLMAAVQAPAPSVWERRPDLPEELDEVLARAMARRPADRHRSVLELVEELAALPWDRRARLERDERAAPGPVEAARGAPVEPPVEARSAAPVEPQAEVPFAAPMEPPVAPPVEATAAAPADQGVEPAFEAPADSTSAEPVEPQARPPLAAEAQPPFGATVESPYAAQVEPQAQPPFAPEAEPPFGATVEPAFMVPVEPQAEPDFAAPIEPQLAAPLARPFDDDEEGDAEHSAFSAACVRLAQRVAGPRASAVLSHAGLLDQVLGGSPDGTDLVPDLVALRGLTDGFEAVLGEEAPAYLYRWGELAGEEWLQSIQRRPAWMAGPPTGRLVDLLSVLIEALNRLQIDERFLWKQLNRSLFRVVHERSEERRQYQACHFWRGTYQAGLRWAGLEKEWLVDEVECGRVSGTQACVFTIVRSEPGR